jgi:hypothetical protein
MRGAEGFIDFRTLIPGILDIPAYRADGLQRVSGDSGCMGQLYAGVESNSLAPIGSPIFFGTGEHVGYALEETSGVENQTNWRPAEAVPVLEVERSEWSWVADWVVTNAVTSSTTFYRLRLLVCFPRAGGVKSSVRRPCFLM